MTRIRLKFIYDIEFSMSCEQDDTIGIVKARLQDVEGLTPENIILRWRDNELADEKNLNYYGLTSSNTDRDPIQISVRNIRNQFGGRRRRRRTKRKGSKKRSRRTRRRR
jgi:hypothetical protein